MALYWGGFGEVDALRSQSVHNALVYQALKALKLPAPLTSATTVSTALVALDRLQSAPEEAVNRMIDIASMV